MSDSEDELDNPFAASFVPAVATRTTKAEAEDSNSSASVSATEEDEHEGESMFPCFAVTTAAGAATRVSACSTSAATASAAVSSTAVSSAATSADDRVQELADALDGELANPFSAQSENVDKLESQWQTAMEENQLLRIETAALHSSVLDGSRQICQQACLEAERDKQVLVEQFTSLVDGHLDSLEESLRTVMHPGAYQKLLDVLDAELANQAGVTRRSGISDSVNLMSDHKGTLQGRKWLAAMKENANLLTERQQAAEKRRVQEFWSDKSPRITQPAATEIELLQKELSKRAEEAKTEEAARAATEAAMAAVAAVAAAKEMRDPSAKKLQAHVRGTLTRRQMVAQRKAREAATQMAMTASSGTGIEGWSYEVACGELAEEVESFLHCKITMEVQQIATPTVLCGDRSLSMSGKRWDFLRAAVGLWDQQLTPEARQNFGMLTFDGATQVVKSFGSLEECLPKLPVSVPEWQNDMLSQEERQDQLLHIKAMLPGWEPGTNIDGALREASKLCNDHTGSNVRAIILLTDGESNMGEKDPLLMGGGHFQDFCTSDEAGLLFLLGMADGAHGSSMETLEKLHERTATHKSTAVFPIENEAECITAVTNILAYLHGVRCCSVQVSITPQPEVPSESNVPPYMLKVPGISQGDIKWDASKGTFTFMVNTPLAAGQPRSLVARIQPPTDLSVTVRPSGFESLPLSQPVAGTRPADKAAEVAFRLQEARIIVAHELTEQIRVKGQLDAPSLDRAHERLKELSKEPPVWLEKFSKDVEDMRPGVQASVAKSLLQDHLHERNLVADDNNSVYATNLQVKIRDALSKELEDVKAGFERSRAAILQQMEHSRKASMSAEQCSKFELNMSAEGFGICICGRQRADHADSALAAGSASSLTPRQGLEKWLNRQASAGEASNEACDHFRISLLGAFGHCKCGFTKSAHKI